MKTEVAVLGGGLLGQAVACIGVAAGATVRLWARRPAARAQLGADLSGVEIRNTVGDTARDATVIVVAVPASALREVVAKVGDVACGDQYLIHAVRGVCPGDGFLLPHRVIREETCLRKIGVLGGPLHAPDLAGDRPLAAVLASRFDETCEAVRALIAHTPVRIHRTRDVIGVEVAGAMSNVAAIAAGMVDGLELGETAGGVVLTHGLSDAARLGGVLGADPRTFSGLAGVGDLIPRRVRSTDRHRALGAALARGAPLAEAVAGAPGEIEGLLTAERAEAAAAHFGIELIVATAVHGVCTGRRTAAAAVEAILQTDLDLGHGLGR